jgi:hypothetical protein
VIHQPVISGKAEASLAALRTARADHLPLTICPKSNTGSVAERGQIAVKVVELQEEKIFKEEATA